MNKKLILFSIICMIYSVNCIKLKELCKNNIFRYFNPYSARYAVINSFHKLSILDPYPKIKYLMLRDLEEPNFLNSDKRNELYQVKSNYDDKIIEIFSNLQSIKKMKDKKDFKPEYDEFSKSRAVTINKLRVLFDDNEFILDTYHKAMFKFQIMIDDLNKMFENKQILKNEHISNEKLQTKLINFRSKLMSNQKPVFSFLMDREESYYRYPILEFGDFTILNSDNSTNVTPESRPNFEIFLVIPFHDSQYPNYVDTKEKCYSKTELPLFYQRERRDL